MAAKKAKKAKTEAKKLTLKAKVEAVPELEEGFLDSCDEACGIGGSGGFYRERYAQDVPKLLRQLRAWEALRK